MNPLAFGQPPGSIFQFAYTVDDLERAMDAYTARLGIGPWFVRGPFQPPRGRYRGQPMDGVSVTLARGFAGHVQVELIVQHDDAPSVWHEPPGPRRYGFHHWGIVTRTFDADVDCYRAAGCEEAFSDRSPTGSRVVYVDTTRELPGMIELVEHTEARERAYTEMLQAAVGWDGRDPVRHEGP